jgi:uncharacterized protein YkwD
MLKCLTLLLTLNSCETVFSKPETATSLNEFRSAHGRSFERRRGVRAENVSYGCKDTACAIRQWAGSSGHRKNMLLHEVRSYGLAFADSRSGRRYWALELGD